MPLTDEEMIEYIRSPKQQEAAIYLLNEGVKRSTSLLAQGKNGKEQKWQTNESNIDFNSALDNVVRNMRSQGYIIGSSPELFVVSSRDMDVMKLKLDLVQTCSAYAVGLGTYFSFQQDNYYPAIAAAIGTCFMKAVQSAREKVSLKTKSLQGSQSKNMITIYSDNISVSLEGVIAHEMTHFMQYKHGMFSKRPFSKNPYSKHKSFFEGHACAVEKNYIDDFCSEKEKFFSNNSGLIGIGDIFVNPERSDRDSSYPYHLGNAFFSLLQLQRGKAVLKDVLEMKNHKELLQ